VLVQRSASRLGSTTPLNGGVRIKNNRCIGPECLFPVSYRVTTFCVSHITSLIFWRIAFLSILIYTAQALYSLLRLFSSQCYTFRSYLLCSQVLPSFLGHTCSALRSYLRKTYVSEKKSEGDVGSTLFRLCLLRLRGKEKSENFLPERRVHLHSTESRFLL